MDPLAIAAKVLLAVCMIVGGLIYAAIRTAADGAGDPDQGFLWGWGPVLAGVAVAIGGLLLLIL